MPIWSIMRTTTNVAALLAIVGCTSAHSWVEAVYQIASNGTMVGEAGYARGWMARTEPGWKDAIPQWLLPLSGQSAYSGEEILNKYPFQASPKYPMLEASAGEYVAFLHMENGHTSLPQNQPLKPRNRGTIFFYGTSNPKPQEKLFDVHLQWNREGTGGDKRGRLLATRNYDDGQCYQPNPGAISLQRAQMLQADGASHDRELICQSDLQLPSDLKAGSVYTVYWYWDWPDLNAEHISMDGTKNGIYPWAGTFMRGEKDPHGFTMAAISRNESYASTVDIKIAGTSSLSAVMAKAQDVAEAWVPQQNIYSMAIKEQMGSNFQVDVDANGSLPKSTKSGDVAKPTLPPPTQPAGSQSGDLTVTQTLTVTVQPSTVFQTIFKTVGEAPGATVPAISSLSTSTVFLTVTEHVPAGAQPKTSGYNFTKATGAQSHDHPVVTPVPLPRRDNWRFGRN